MWLTKDISASSSPRYKRWKMRSGVYANCCDIVCGFQSLQSRALQCPTAILVNSWCNGFLKSPPNSSHPVFLFLVIAIAFEFYDIVSFQFSTCARRPVPCIHCRTVVEVRFFPCYIFPPCFMPFKSNRIFLICALSTITKLIDVIVFRLVCWGSIKVFVATAP